MPVDEPTTVAVVVPTFNRCGQLAQLLEALAGEAFEGTYEIVVVNDGSTDGTTSFLESWSRRESNQSHRLIHTPNRGPASARNTGWRATQASIVAFIDDDCVPEPDWLAAGSRAIGGDLSLGVVQGRTTSPPGTVLGDWTITREVSRASPYFESHNIFYRRAALVAVGGFDEELGMYGEDTALGWAVVSAGWGQAFASDAVVHHEASERPLSWQLRYSYVSERNLVAVAAKYPAFRDSAFWRPWAFQRHHVHVALALAGVVLGLWKRPALVLVVPYLRVRDPGPHRRRWTLTAERIAIDAAAFAGRRVGALRAGVLVI